MRKLSTIIQDIEVMGSYFKVLLHELRSIAEANPELSKVSVTSEPSVPSDSCTWTSTDTDVPEYQVY